MSKPIRILKILASVELGSPAADCAHFGICSVEVISPEQWAVFSPRHIRHVKAILSLAKQGGLRFEFPFESMRPDTRVQFFSPDGFRVDSCRQLPEAIASVLSLPAHASISSGVYAIGLSEDGFAIELSVAPAEQEMAIAA